MPSLAPLDTLESAVNLARVRLLDAIQGLQGDVLTDVQPFTLVYVNGAWRRFQELLVNYGVTWFKPEIILPNFLATGSSDPGSQVTIDWDTVPALPQNLISPLILWERAAGVGSFFPMDKLENGLPGVPKGTFNKVWEWRNGQIYMPGATQATDVRIRYAGFYPDFVTPTPVPPGIPFADQSIPIMRAMNPLGWLIASEAAKARGDIDSEQFDQQAMTSLKYIFDLDMQAGRELGHDSELGKMPDKFSATMGPTGPRGMQTG